MDISEFKTYLHYRTAIALRSPDSSQETALLRAVGYTQLLADDATESSLEPWVNTKLRAYEQLYWAIRSQRDTTAFGDVDTNGLEQSQVMMRNAVRSCLPDGLQAMAESVLNVYFEALRTPPPTAPNDKDAEVAKPAPSHLEVVTVTSKRSAYVIAVDTQDWRVSFRHFEILPMFWNASLKLADDVDDDIERHLKTL
jgi:hypothetical protein